MKTLALIILSAVALFATPAENATALNMALQDYEMMMALSGIVGGSLFAYRLFNI